MTDSTSPDKGAAPASLSSGFALDRADHEQILASAAECMQQKPQLRWAALIDTVFMGGVSRSAPFGLHGYNCYGSDTLNDLDEVAPWLIPLHPDEQALDQLAELVRRCDGQPILSILGTTNAIHQLPAYWEALHWAHTSDGQRFILRFADTRVLPTLQQVLSPAQWAALHAPVEQWLYVGRDGRLAALELAAPGVESVSRIELSPEQLDRLTQAAEADVAYSQICQESPDLLPWTGDPSQGHRFLCSLLDFARRHGIEPWPDKMAWITAELISDGQLHQRPEFERLIAARDWTPGRLGERLRQLRMVRGDAS